MNMTKSEQPSVKLPKLKIHQSNFSHEELVINPKDFPLVEIDDVVEIYHEEENYSRLLLQVKCLDDSIQQNTVSVLSSIATAFCLKPYLEVHVRPVSPKDVALDLVELVFKEQYLSRADMWRLRNSLVKSVVYVNKTSRFADIRATVDELWSRGERVTCGYITYETRVTFRSATAQVNIFIQLSCEMWDFDNYGDLYFEKTVNGYLIDLFSKWKEKNCSHDVTITLFSRTFYDAESIDDFPKYMRECLREDYKGRFYEDFYRVVVQNERYDDWTSTLIQLKTLFNEYRDTVLHYHARPGHTVPTARNSNASEGNFLEVLNMGLNIYEKFYVDRNFDRTGKLSLVITPGAGVFDVDRQLTFITKQRTIDLGNSCDLVCMGEQPLHVVPLLKFHNSNPSHSTDVGNDYSIPHWINHSFYTSENQEAHMRKNKFVPRIRAPVLTAPPSSTAGPHSGFAEQVSPYLGSDAVPFVDYDAYDAQVFSLGSFRLNPQTTSEGMRHSKTADGEQAWGRARRRQQLPLTTSMRRELRQLNVLSSPDTGAYLSTSYEKERVCGCELWQRKVVGSCGSPADHHHSLHNYRPSKALINPFAPSRLHFKVTSNRRRWAHAFPTNTQGASVQPHHQHSTSSTITPHADRPSPPARPGNSMRRAYESRRSHTSKHSESDAEELVPPARTKTVSVTVSTSSDSGGEGVSRESQVTFRPIGINRTSSHSNVQSVEGGLSASVATNRDMPAAGSAGGRSRSTSLMYSRSSSVHKELSDWGWEDDHNWLFGVTGEQEWTPHIHTGMDWKSMMRPASLPITTDFFPDRRTLNDGYYVNPYTLIPEHFSSELESEKRQPLTTREVYNELVYQRIAQGFQIVLHDKPLTIPADPASNMSPSPYQGSLLGKRRGTVQQELVLSIGRIFHHLKLDGDEITVKRIWPKYPYPQKMFHYTYRFQVPDSEAYDVSWTEFRNEKLEHYNWNYVDQYICTRGEDENFLLNESMKYWRARFFLLPCNNPAIKTITDDSCRCDIYPERGEEEQRQLTDGFVRFIEAINKIRRLPRPARMTDLPKRRVSLPVSPMAGSKADKLPGGRQDLCDSPHLLVGSPTLSLTHRESASPVPGAGEMRTPLRQSTPHHDIVDAMLDPSTGLQFVREREDRQVSLPPHCFVAREAHTWLTSRMLDLTPPGALSLLQELLQERYIVHASGDTRGHTVFINGYVLYAICDRRAPPHPMSPDGLSVPYKSAFEHEWCEVETEWPQPASRQPAFLHPHLPPAHRQRPANPSHPAARRSDDPLMLVKLGALSREAGALRTVRVDVAYGARSDRAEWGTARYHQHYHPHAAFEIEVQWLVATGCILGELVSGWARKAEQNGFHILPMPGDPFALPFTHNSDPLRGPIFVPLIVDGLRDHPSLPLFSDYPDDTREERLLLFQHSILKRFGFMRDRYRPGRSQPSVAEQAPPTYIHCSGGMFVMIPDGDAAVASGEEWRSTDAGAEHDKYRVGFLWSWNFLLTKRWRSPRTGDEHYQDKMLADFRAFCANDDNRLRDYWDDSRAQFLQSEDSEMEQGHDCTLLHAEAGVHEVIQE